MRSVSNSKAGRLRSLVAFPVAALVVATGAGLTYLLRTQGLEVAADWAQLLSLIVAVVPLLARQRRTPTLTSTTSSPDQVEKARQALAALVLRQWRDEILVRQLDNPAPLSVRWRLTELDSVDSVGDAFRPNLLRLLLGRGRQRFEGHTNRIDKLADEFRGLARRRLVILGEPGMGKTTLAVLLLRELLANDRPDDPVPVLMSMSGWHPLSEPWRDWMARRLATDYPALRAAGFGPDAARGLIGDRRVLPILDGLDELPESVRPAVLRALNAEMTKDDQLILTCRTTEYETASAAGGGISGGAVIEPRPLEMRHAATYLTHCLKSQPSRHGESWPDLLSTLTTDRGSPLARALTTPLDLWLLRKIYIDTGADPAELRDRVRFPTATAITDHLLDHLTAALITANPPQPNADEQHPFRARHAWAPADAQRWLSFLAHHLSGIGSRDLAWWQLHRRIQFRLVYRMTAGLVLGLVFGALTGLAGWLAGEFVDEPAAGSAGGLLGGFVVGLAFSLASDHTAEPAYADLRLSGRVGLLLREIVYRTAIGLIIGLVVGLAFQLSGVLSGGLAGVVVIGLTFGVVTALMVWVATPLTNDRAPSPASALRGDLQLAFVRSVVFSLAGGLAIGFLAGFVGFLVVAVTLVLMSALIVALAVGSPPKVASSVYLATVCILHCQRRVPLQLMSFLDDAHRLGLLRLTGPVYQFRHAKLQDRLAHTHALIVPERQDGRKPAPASPAHNKQSRTP